MDNVTHTLIGVGLARVLPERLQRPAFYWAAVIGNNLPDSDVLQKLWPGTDGFDYLVHHRGYTHSFLAAIPLGLLTAWIAKKIGREKTWDPALVGVGLLACFMHVGADFLNNYGVHPFTPFSNRWYYGDSMFILEPLLWLSLLPLAVQTAQRRWAKILWCTVAAALLVLVWTSPLLLKRIMVSTTLFAALVAGLQYWLKSRIVGVGAFALVLTVFISAGARTQHEVEQAWEQNRNEGEVLLDIDAAPSPGNPFCWRSYVASTDGDRYVTRLAVTSLWPKKIPIEKCLSERDRGKTADLRPLSEQKPTREVRFAGQVTIARTEFEQVRSESCTFRRLLAFARFPFIARQDDGSLIVGDLRYDHNRDLGFTEAHIRLPDECPGGFESPWEPPFLRGHGT